MALRKSKKAEHPAWRPDFRNPDELPDIKVIRTDFLLNLVAVSIAIGLLGLVVFREYRAAGLRETLEDLSTNIQNNREADRENVRMSRDFAEIERSMKELVRFHNVPVRPAPLLAELAEMQPDEIILETVNFSGGFEGTGKNRPVRYTLVLSGTVEHSDENPASQVITDYRTALAELPSLKPYFIESEQPGFNRNASLGIFNFTLRVTLSDTPKKPAS